MPKDKDKNRKGKQQKNLFGKVKKVVKKSKRRVDDERFQKEVERTIAFLQKLRAKISQAQTKRKPTLTDTDRRKR